MSGGAALAVGDDDDTAAAAVAAAVAAVAAVAAGVDDIGADGFSTLMMQETNSSKSSMPSRSVSAL